MKDSLFSEWFGESWIATCKRIKLDYSLTSCSHTKIVCWVKDLNVRPETMKLLEENVGTMPSNISTSNNFLALYPQARETKLKINKWYYIKLRSICIVKEAINKMKRPPTEREKIFANGISYKELTSKIRKALVQINVQKPNDSTKGGQSVWMEHL